MPADRPVPTVSVVMPCFNAERHLSASVGSLLAQSLPDWELIAVDDGSRDGTLAWLRGVSDPRIRVHAQSNQGVSAARNAGLALARGDLVAFLDADDTWAADFLARMTIALEANPHAVLAYCGWQNLGLPGGRGQPFVPPDYERPDKQEQLFAGCRWPVHAALTRRDAVVAAGGFDRSLTNAEDYALWLKLATARPIVRVPEVLAFYHFHDGVQASSDRARAALQLLRAQERYLEAHPAFLATLGRDRSRELLFGNLLRTGYDAYWKRDLTAARAIFRRAMRAGFGTRRDWIYLLPALLPIGVHRALLNALSRDARTGHTNGSCSQ